MSNHRWRNRPTPLACAVAALIVLSTARTDAQTLADDPCLRDAGCQRLLARAQAASQEQRYDEALAIYNKAYGSSQASWLQVNIGRIQQKLGHYQEARQSYLNYLDSPRQANDEEQRRTAREYLGQTELQLSQQARLVQVERPPSERQPIYKKWWFWLIIGGVTAGGVAATVGGVAASRNALPAVPAEAQFHPF